VTADAPHFTSSCNIISVRTPVNLYDNGDLVHGVCSEPYTNSVAFSHTSVDSTNSDLVLKEHQLCVFFFILLVLRTNFVRTMDT
jgi:hypothetical protein